MEIILNHDYQMLYSRTMKINTLLLLILSVVSISCHAENSSGKATYEQYCSMCHASGLAGAPKFQNAEEWKTRLATHGINGLVEHSMTGVNGVMPPKGSCMTCTKEQLKEAIEYMLPPK